VVASALLSRVTGALCSTLASRHQRSPLSFTFPEDSNGNGQQRLSDPILYPTSNPADGRRAARTLKRSMTSPAALSSALLSPVCCSPPPWSLN